MAKSNIKRIRRLEDVAIGAGFLLQTLRARYGADFGYGIEEQVNDCIRDTNEISRNRVQREVREAKQSQVEAAYTAGKQ